MLPTNSKQDRGGVRTAADIERKYDLSSIVGMKKAILQYEAQLTKTNGILENFIKSTVGTIENMQSQIDGNITTWFDFGEPTLNTYPANEWDTEEMKINHIGDLYYDRDTGYAYRYEYTKDNVYSWEKIKDNDVVEALAIANAAKDTADNKRRVFVARPVPPYDNGDLWFTSSGEIYICQISKDEKQSYAEKDFIVATKYTDDTYAKKVGDELTVVKGTVTTIKEGMDSFSVEIQMLEDDVAVAITQILANTEEIDLRVAKNEIISAINLSEEKILIQAKHLELKGAVEFSSLTQDVQNKFEEIRSTATDALDSVKSMKIGGRNLIKKGKVAVYKGSLNLDNFVSSGELIQADSEKHGGFIFDSITYYEPATEYTLSGFLSVIGGSIKNIYFFNGKAHIFKSFYIDGVEYGSPLNAKMTSANEVLNDGLPHYFELHFATAQTIPDDSSTNYTYCQFNKEETTAIEYKITGFKLEKGNVATDWTPAPEDIEGAMGVINEMATSANSTALEANTNASNALERATHHYGTCSTAAATVAKVVTLSGFSLYTGAQVTVKFTYANTAANPTLNVNSTGAKKIRVNNKNITSQYYWGANNTVTFIFDGTYWVVSDTSASSILASWASTIDKTYIDGAKIYTGSITADKINVEDLFAQDIEADGSLTVYNVEGTQKVVLKDGGIELYSFDTRGEGGYRQTGAIYPAAGMQTGASGTWLFDGVETISGNNLDYMAEEIATISANMPYLRGKGTYENHNIYNITGYITSGAKDAILYIPMCWAPNVSDATVTSLKISLRVASGGYLGGASGFDATSLITGATVRAVQGILQVNLSNADGWGISNNSNFCGNGTISYVVS